MAAAGPERGDGLSPHAQLRHAKASRRSSSLGLAYVQAASPTDGGGFGTTQKYLRQEYKLGEVFCWFLLLRTQVTSVENKAGCFWAVLAIALAKVALNQLEFSILVVVSRFLSQPNPPNPTLFFSVHRKIII